MIYLSTLLALYVTRMSNRDPLKARLGTMSRITTTGSNQRGKTLAALETPLSQIEGGGLAVPTFLETRRQQALRVSLTVSSIQLLEASEIDPRKARTKQKSAFLAHHG
jgi:hypothetical protein